MKEREIGLGLPPTKRQKINQEQSTEFDTENKVKVEIIDEAMSPQTSEDLVSEFSHSKCLKQEIKTEAEDFGNYDETDLRASSIQVHKLIEDNLQIHNRDLQLLKKEEQLENKRQLSLECIRKSEDCHSSIGTVNYSIGNYESSLNSNLSTNCDNAVSESKSNLHECTLCGRHYSGKDSLKTHILSVHKKVKPFKCLECDFICSQKGNLSKHIKSVHENWKPFMCAECDSTFSRKAHLSLHIKTVHEKFFEHLSHHLKPVHIDNQNIKK